MRRTLLLICARLLLKVGDFLHGLTVGAALRIMYRHATDAELVDVINQRLEPMGLALRTAPPPLGPPPMSPPTGLVN